MLKQKTLVVLALLGAMALVNVPIFAQAAQSAPSAGVPPKASLDQDIQMLREDVRSSKKQITAGNMNLTADEATKFWPIYDQYVGRSCQGWRCARGADQGICGKLQYDYRCPSE